MKFIWGLIVVLAFVGLTVGVVFAGIALGVNAVADAARPALLVAEQIGFWVSALLIIVSAAFALYMVIALRSVIGGVIWIAVAVYAALTVRNLMVIFWIPGASPGWFPTLVAVLLFGVVVVAAAIFSKRREQFASASKSS